MARIFLVWIFLAITFSADAQKIDRAINAYKEKKYDKALELFGDLIKKNQTDFDAALGLALTNVAIIEELNIEPTNASLVDLILSFDAIYGSYQKLSLSDQSVLINAFGISSLSDIGILRSKVSELLWQKFVSKATDISVIEDFKKNYLRSKLLEPKVENLLSELYYKKAVFLNDLTEYRNYLSRFPQTIYRSDVSSRIMFIEFGVARDSRSIQQLKAFLDKYPQSKYRDTIEYDMATLYFSSLNADLQDRDAIQKVIVELQKLHAFELRNKLIDSCKSMIFGIDRESISKSENLDEINSFISTYEKKYDVVEIISYRNKVWKAEILSENIPAANKLRDFLKITQCPQEELQQVFERIAKNLSTRLKDGLEQLVKNKIQNETSLINSSKIDYLFSFIRNLTNVQVLVKPSDIYDQLKKAEEEDADEILKGIISRIGIENMASMQKIYFKCMDGECDLIEVLYPSNVTGVSSSIYEFNNQTYIKLPPIKLTFPIFTAIKSRYKVTSFTPPQIKSKDPNGYIVQLYGFQPENSPCCPAYTIDMQFVKNGTDLIPVTALSIDNFYDTIETSKNLNQFIYIDLTKLLNE